MVNSCSMPNSGSDPDGQDLLAKDVSITVTTDVLY